MPGEPVQNSQGGERDYVCYHERALSLWLVTQSFCALANRFVCFINIFSEP